MDTTPLTENLADVAANEGVTPAAEPPKKNKGGRPRGPNYGKKRTKKKEPSSAAGSASSSSASSSASSSSSGKNEPPFSASELQGVLEQVGTALFALPGEALAQKRPDLRESLALSPDEAALGGKAVVWYAQERFPSFLDKWGPEAMLAGCVLMFYGPRLLLMAKTPKPKVDVSVDGKPSPVRAV